MKPVSFEMRGAGGCVIDAEEIVSIEVATEWDSAFETRVVVEPALCELRLFSGGVFWVVGTLDEVQDAIDAALAPPAPVPRFEWSYAWLVGFTCAAAGMAFRSCL